MFRARGIGERPTLPRLTPTPGLFRAPSVHGVPGVPGVHGVHGVRWLSALIKPMDFVQHPTNMGVAVARLQNSVARPGITPMNDLDSHTPHAPSVHLGSARAVEIDRVPSGEVPTVIIDDVRLSGGQDHEFRSGRPSRPIGCSAPDLARLQGCSRGVGIRVLQMITFVLIVGSRSDLHEFGPFEWSFIRR